VINQATIESPNFSAFPVKAKSSGTKEALSTHCYICISDKVCCIDAQPRPGLLWLWAKNIKELSPEWDVTPPPQPQKDKKLWSRISMADKVMREDKDKLQAVEKECQA
jgi:hypothetical protein